MPNTNFRNIGFITIGSTLAVSTLSLIINSTSPITAQVNFKQNSSIGIVKKSPKIVSAPWSDYYLKSVDVLDIGSNKILNVELYELGKTRSSGSISYKHFSISEQQWNQCVGIKGKEVIFTNPYSHESYIASGCYGSYIGLSDKYLQLHLWDRKPGKNGYVTSEGNVRKAMNDFLKYFNNSTGTNFKYIP
ncbi:hypothetical protein NIES2100_35320 [Calothrix sp. NIES-2100]|uniref:hypothetical protein n=1 Tax=Calothrix sp. NIES-2100 TaxID=1954172 RepID=UPI000B5F79D6|nr:hypothetical protein NIES2100_35320 [Calothrix sp. NIES-2100]